MLPREAYDINLKKIDKLAPYVKWAVRQFMDDSFAQEIYWFINSGFRTYAEQLYLYAKGRWKEGSRVTWTMNSDHLRGLAIDLTMIEGSYKEADDVARVYGIHRDPVLIGLGDLGHYDLKDSVMKPTTPDIDPVDRRRRLLRRLEREPDGDTRAIVGAVLARLEARLRRDGIPF